MREKRNARPTAAHDRVGETKQSARLSTMLSALFAIASGVAVANAYFAHPMLDAMADAVGLPRARSGLIVATTQIGYAMGLILLVPLGDLVDRRKLVIVQSLLSVAALLAVGFATHAAFLLASMAATGFLAVVTQSFVAYAASLTGSRSRGRVVGFVTSGIVIGILLPRTIAGTLTDLSGWRTVYFASAGATLVIVALLAMALPTQSPASGKSYPKLVSSTFHLLLTDHTLRIRGVLATLIFADMTILLTPLVLPLAAPPFSFSHTQIGLFGLAGVAGALAASHAGSWADRGLGQRTTGVALALMLIAWGPIALMRSSILLLVAGVVVVDFGVQAVHVTNQAMIYRARRDAQSRLTAAYMVFYSIGSATGSALSTQAYTLAGWQGVCLLGGSVSGAALLFWVLTLRLTPASATVAQ